MTPMHPIRTALAASPLFARLADDVLEQLAAASRLCRYRSGELVFREKEPCEGFYVVAEGVFRVYKIAPDGRERTLHIVKPPHAFAEAAMFGDGLYPAFAGTLSDGTAIFVPRRPFLALLQEQPESAVRMFESLSQWLHRLVDQLETEAFLNARARLAGYLLREVHRQSVAGQPCTIRLPFARKEIAAQLGMAPETLSRAQADLETRGLIEVEARLVRIPSTNALEDLIVAETPST